MRVGVVLASLNRSEDLGHILVHLRDQTVPPTAVVLSLEKPEDAPSDVGSEIDVIYGEKGLCAQRNRGLKAIQDRCDVVVFYDDDYVPSKASIEQIGRVFERAPEIAGATGLVLADGVSFGGIHYPEAKSIVEAYDLEVHAEGEPVEITTAYGCNMAFRMNAIKGLSFDEKLPLYGWQEDVDFAGQVRTRGKMIRTNAFAGVHCGVSRGRMPGKRLGFSQIVNPVYLWRKGSMRPAHAIKQMVRNFLANHGRVFTPEAHIDRRGRMVGNWLGIAHVLSGKADPMKVLQL